MGPHAGGPPRTATNAYGPSLNKSASLAVPPLATMTNVQINNSGVGQGPTGNDRFVSTQRQANE